MAPVYYHDGKFPPAARLDWPRLIPLLGPAAAAVARYDGMLVSIPNPGVLLAPLTTQEAVLSSRIEGTQATMGEVLEFEAGHIPESPARTEDIREVLNYRSAMRQAEKMLKELPLCQRVIREAHSTLLAGVRGENKTPGDYRRGPNWIGPLRCTIDNAKFVPIGADKLPDAMSAWESYIHEDTLDRLVQLAILHAEFEALHPFQDGNGRIGRMLVPLFLWQHKLIRAPTFYISAYFEARRDAYYDALLAVSRDDDWTGWCQFFLEALRAQAEDNLAKTQGILNLYNDMKSRVAKLIRSQYAILALDWIFQKPCFVSTHFVATAGIPEATARRILRTLRDGDILKKVIFPNLSHRGTFLMFPKLLNIAEGADLF
ncbi:MAG: Adenosine monophosphate-protein transferase SoFic [Verrucomicrobia subdivision 3 bacterium]|nr:Adenosine monophosphate-protein transferase SoFic [Limisphaerales bacterium]MCS1412980.1 Adenosine monophosphate-protein transferase SoFic [Limisphaerales bacterium]